MKGNETGVSSGSIQKDPDPEQKAALISRRSLIAGVSGAVVLLGIGGVARVAVGDTPLRPPGGQDEQHFIGTCIRCGRCQNVCPRDAIKTCEFEDGIISARTPKVNYRLGHISSGYKRLREAQTPLLGLLEAEGSGFCDFCNLCIENCPVGALVAFDPASEWIGEAVLATDRCIAYEKLGGCRKCVDYCPFDAITVDEFRRPVVIPEKCNGCGVCENICPASSYRTYHNDTRRGINVHVNEQGRPA
ncbi:MAG: 4Fe-4S dicluster domain-containing protein [Coriobacteriales bacterium]|jgi:ferredoxin-type protein NapG|nr:4Fe-4S dicluster domain-containing protein [Coriobacteriales bacterium]